MRITLFFFLVVLLGGCASVGEDGRFRVDGHEAAARGANAAIGGLIGCGLGEALVGDCRRWAALGAAAGAAKDPRECSEGKTVSEETETKNGSPVGDWRGRAERRKDCGANKRRNYFGRRYFFW